MPPLRPNRTVLLGLLLALALSGCDRTRVCPAVVRPAVEVVVKHADTGRPLADRASGVLQDGDYTDSLRVQGYNGDGTPTTLAGGLGRAGTYEVRVDVPGFLPWSRSGIEVDQGDCTVNTQRLTADLHPADEAS